MPASKKPPTPDCSQNTEEDYPGPPDQSFLKNDGGIENDEKHVEMYQPANPGGPKRIAKRA
jgi:hypothetical protein